MIPLDPVDFTSAAPFDPISYYVHMTIGLVGWVAAIAALVTRKGSTVHIWAGRTFIAAIIVVTLSALILLATRWAAPLFVSGVTAVYAVAGAFLALRAGSPGVRRVEYGLFALEILACAVFLYFALPLIAEGRIPLAAIPAVMVIPAILLAGDIHFFMRPDQRAAMRIRRHMARMIWALALAVRAPLIEIYANVGLPLPLVVIGPIVGAILLIWAFRAKAGRLSPKGARTPLPAI